jgi:2-isopropylmalate synthase
MTMKAAEFGIELDDRAAGALSEHLKQLEAEGFVFEAADASLELLMRASTGWKQEFFSVEAYRVTAYHREVPQPNTGASVEITTEATVKLRIGEERIASVGEGNGPVNALDAALRAALNPSYPSLERIHLTDFKVRVLDSTADTGAVTRVLIDSTNGDETWTTIGVSPNIIEASWMALIDAVVFGLLLAGS